MISKLFCNDVLCGPSTDMMTSSNETFSALLTLCAVTAEFPSQRPVARSFDVFFDLRLNKCLSTESWGRWFEMPSRSLWCHCNVSIIYEYIHTMHYNIAAVKLEYISGPHKSGWIWILRMLHSLSSSAQVIIIHTVPKVASITCA